MCEVAEEYKKYSFKEYKEVSMLVQTRAFGL